MTDECKAIKAMLAEIERRLRNAPSINEEPMLLQLKAELQEEWRQKCGNGINWAGLVMDPPSDEMNMEKQMILNIIISKINAMEIIVQNNK